MRCHMSIFNALKASPEEAVATRNDKALPARVTRYDVTDARPIHESFNVPQDKLAKALGTRFDAVKSWEQKQRNPAGLAAKVLVTMQDDSQCFNILAARQTER